MPASLLFAGAAELALASAGGGGGGVAVVVAGATVAAGGVATTESAAVVSAAVCAIAVIGMKQPTMTADATAQIVIRGFTLTSALLEKVQLSVVQSVICV
jgi:hypothetical protein